MKKLLSPPFKQSVVVPFTPVWTVLFGQPWPLLSALTSVSHQWCWCSKLFVEIFPEHQLVETIVNPSARRKLRLIKRKHFVLCSSAECTAANHHFNFQLLMALSGILFIYSTTHQKLSPFFVFITALTTTSLYRWLITWMVTKVMNFHLQWTILIFGLWKRSLFVIMHLLISKLLDRIC